MVNEMTTLKTKEPTQINIKDGTPDKNIEQKDENELAFSPNLLHNK